MRKIGSLVWLSLAACLAGCAITVDVPVNRFDSPETTGKSLRVELDAAIGSTNEAVLTQDASVSAPDTAHPTSDHGVFFRFGAGLGVLDNLDIELRNFNEIQAKYQFLGEPRLKTYAGNFSAAVTLGTGIGYDSANGSGLTQQYQDDLTTYFLDAALIGGVRMTDWLLVYLGPYYRYTPYSGHYAAGPINTALPAASAFSGTVTAYGGDLGFEIGNPIVQGRVECAYGQLKSGSLNSGMVSCGGQLAFNFGAH